MRWSNEKIHHVIICLWINIHVHPFTLNIPSVRVIIANGSVDFSSSFWKFYGMILVYMHHIHSCCYVKHFIERRVKLCIIMAIKSTFELSGFFSLLDQLNVILIAISWLFVFGTIYNINFTTENIIYTVQLLLCSVNAIIQPFFDRISPFLFVRHISFYCHRISQRVYGCN